MVLVLTFIITGKCFGTFVISMRCLKNNQNIIFKNAMLLFSPNIRTPAELMLFSLLNYFD
jgi:hypothetical protein